MAALARYSYLVGVSVRFKADNRQEILKFDLDLDFQITKSSEVEQKVLDLVRQKLLGSKVTPENSWLVLLSFSEYHQD